MGFHSVLGFNSANSNFPFSSGILLSTGRADQVGSASNTTDLNAGNSTWTGDPDLENAVGINNTLNASSIEFEFVSVTNQIQFNYILASEEYQQDFPCNVSDAFVILIKPFNRGSFRNIAVLPNGAPVGVQKIHPEIVGECSANNEQYFAGYNLGDTNFEGRTVPLKAVANVTPGVRYQIKMVIADDFDENYDSAVFIEGGSFNSGIDLGQNVNSCLPTVLNASVGNPNATYRWFLNNNLLPQSTSQITASASGTYRAEATINDGAINCSISDTVIVNINPDSIDFTVDDVVRCDPSGNNTSRLFDLNAVGQNILRQLGSGNFNYSFYGSQIDLNNRINPLPFNYRNTTTPETVFVLIEDPVSGCYGSNSFELRIDRDVMGTDVVYEVCTDTAGFPEVNLADINDLVTNSGNASTIKYYPTLIDAQTEINEIFSPFQLMQDVTDIVARIDDSEGACFVISHVTIDTKPRLTLLSNTAFIDACDNDRDGFAVFDLTTRNNAFATPSQNIEITYHLTEEDALNNVAAISNVQSFRNTERSIQQIYVRVMDDSNTCAGIGLLTLYTNYLIAETNITDVVECDDISNDGIEDFDMSAIKNSIRNNAEVFSIEFYLNRSDRQNRINAIDASLPFRNTVNPQQIFVRITSDECEEEDNFELIVAPYFEAPPIPDLTYCDEDQDLRTTLELSRFDGDIREIVPDSSMRYFLTAADAAAGINAIQTFNNSNNFFTLYVEITNRNGCTDWKPFNIRMLPAPIINSPSEILLCDTNQDGFLEINLNNSIPEIVTNPGQSVTFYRSRQDAEANASPITASNSYFTQSTTVFVRITDQVTQCPSFTELPITINTIHEIHPIPDIIACENDGDDVGQFLFSELDDTILRGDSTKNVSYYQNLIDAINADDEIDKNNLYQNTTSPETIYYRVENSDNPLCPSFGFFDIRVEDAPIFIDPSDIEFCDNDDDGFLTFDLATVRTQILGANNQNLSVSFHASMSDAQANQNILNEQFTNTSNPQTLFARVSTTQGCVDYSSFNIGVIARPIVNPVEPSYVCLDDDTLESAYFNLEERELEIIGARNFNTNVTWHFTRTDAEAGIAQIPPNQIRRFDIFDDTNVYLRIFDTITGCYNVQELELFINLTPFIFENRTIQFCETENEIIDLNLAIHKLFLDEGQNVTFEVYRTRQEARDENNPIPLQFDYTSGIRTLYLRAQLENFSCKNIERFDICINPKPRLLNGEDLLVKACDSNNDGIEAIQLASLDDQVLEGLSIGDHRVEYYFTQNDRQSQVNQITQFNYAGDQNSLYALVFDQSTGCYSEADISLQLVATPKPEIRKIYTKCDNNNVELMVSGLQLSETVLWSTGETTSRIYVNEAGTYFVEVFNHDGCSTEVETRVIQSNKAIIEDVIISNFQANNTITIMVSGNGEYRYSLNGGEMQVNNDFSNVSSGPHTIEVMDLKGCETVVKEDILVLDYPRYFSPNGDGSNDTWKIDYLEGYDVGDCKIFNRKGRLLKSFDTRKESWDGTFNEIPVDESDYWFEIDILIDGRPVRVRNHFSLIRS
jgi:gliding motility-associated-like protein